MDNGVPMSPEVARKVLDLIKSDDHINDRIYFGLTPREIEILKLQVDAHSYK